jgi:hypothetical protein
MSDKVFALLTVVISSIFGFLVAVLTNRMSASREQAAFKRQLYREKLDATRALYEDAFFVLERLVIQEGTGDKVEQNELTRVMARLSLRSTTDICMQYERAVESAQAWADEFRKTQPRRVGDYEIITSDLWGTKQKATLEAESRYSAFHQSFYELKTKMILHLTELEKSE